MTSYRQQGTVLTDHAFAVPLDHGRPDGEQIEVFAREVVAADSADAALPWLLFLQGGPGFGAQRPVGRESWLDRALRDYRVLLLDQRGTGRSSPATRQTLAQLGAAATAQADRRGDPRPARLGDQPVPARRAAGQRRRGPGPADRLVPRRRLTGRRPGDPDRAQPTRTSVCTGAAARRPA